MYGHGTSYFGGYVAPYASFAGALEQGVCPREYNATMCAYYNSVAAVANVAGRNIVSGETVAISPGGGRGGGCLDFAGGNGVSVTRAGSFDAGRDARLAHGYDIQMSSFRCADGVERSGTDCSRTGGVGFTSDASVVGVFGDDQPRCDKLGDDVVVPRRVVMDRDICFGELWFLNGGSVSAGDTSCEMSANRIRNRANRRAKKLRKQQGKLKCDVVSEPVIVNGSGGLAGFDVSDSSDSGKPGGDSCSEASELRLSLERKWKVENELAAERASRQLEVLRANDIQQEIKKYRTKVSAETERNMVSIEKTHALLAATGNVPGEFRGSAETVIDGVPGLVSGSGTISISPDSSASMKEFRMCQKKLLDAEALNAKYQAATGWSPEALDVLKKHVWTDTPENHELLDSLYPDGYGIDNDCDSGKFCVVGL